MALLAPAMKGIKVAEYPPNLIKKTVVGAGHAEKKQIQLMVGILLPRAKFDNADEADALAIAICHANHRGVQAVAGGGQGGREQVAGLGTVARSRGWVTRPARRSRVSS